MVYGYSLCCDTIGSIHLVGVLIPGAEFLKPIFWCHIWCSEYRKIAFFRDLAD